MSETRHATMIGNLRNISRIGTNTIAYSTFRLWSTVSSSYIYRRVSINCHNDAIIVYRR
jgi:hypothetical protein